MTLRISYLTVLLSFFSLAAVPLSYSESRSRDPQTPSRGLTLARALALTLESSPELASYSWDIRAAEARIIQSKLRPNPEVSLQGENITGSGNYKNADVVENTLQFSQLIELAGKRQARVRQARSGNQLANWDYEIKRLEVLKETTFAFIEVLAAQQRVELAEETVSIAEKVIPVTQKQLEAGKASEVELTRANVAVASARVELEQARRDLLIGKSNLAAQWGAKAVDFDNVSGELDRVKPLPQLATLTAKLQRNPQLARWTAERERRTATLESARAHGRPDVTLSIGPRLIGKGDDVTLVAGFSLPLPLWNRNQGNIAEAEANLSKVTDERTAAEARAYARLNASYQTLVRAKVQADILDRDVLTGANTALTKILEGYGVGRYSQLDVFDARRTLNDLRAQKLRALADYHKASAEIDAFTATPGESPVSTTYSNHDRRSRPTNK